MCLSTFSLDRITIEKPSQKSQEASGYGNVEDDYEYLDDTFGTYYTDTQTTISSCGRGSSGSYTLYAVTAENQYGEGGASGPYGICAEVSGGYRVVSAEEIGKQGLQEQAQQQAQQGQALPEAFALEGNAPNPFRQQTEIRYALPEAAEVELVVYDVMGREVARPVDGSKPAGFQHATFEAEGLPSGVYFYRLNAGERFTESGRLVLVK